MGRERDEMGVDMLVLAILRMLRPLPHRPEPLPTEPALLFQPARPMRTTSSPTSWLHRGAPTKISGPVLLPASALAARAQ